MYLAQANFSFWKEDLLSSHFQEFLTHAEKIMTVAGAHPSLIWQNPAKFVEDEEVIRVFGERRMIMNMSVWDSYASLKDFVYRHAHGDAMREKHHWFEPQADKNNYVLWWVKPDQMPNLVEAKQKFDLLQSIGPSPEAFNFKQRYDQNRVLVK